MENSNQDITQESSNELISNVSQEQINIVPNEQALIEYKEIDEPCVALTIIGENRLTDVEVFAKRGFKFSLKTIFSTIALTILNLFI